MSPMVLISPFIWTCYAHSSMRLLLTVMITLCTASCLNGSASAGDGHVLPPPALDVTVGGHTSETAVLAGGCFWGIQGVYQHVTGVTSAVSGYAGGQEDTAQ